MSDSKLESSSQSQSQQPNGGLTQIPSPNQTQWRTQADQFLQHNYAPPLANLVRGEGTHVWDSEGKKYLDFLAGIAVNSLGHCHPAWVQALTTQVNTLGHVSNIFVSNTQLQLAEKLAELAGGQANTRVLFTNSGTEANEAAIKLARLWGRSQGRTKVLALENGFHGRTLGALSITAKAAYREPFEPLLGDTDRIPATIAALEEQIDDTVAALFIETIQGEGGVSPLGQEFIQRAREITRERGALLIVDEVQTGIARTGTMFSFENYGITPDAFTLAKGLAGGMPIGALVTLPTCSDLFYPGSHGCTFGGNPLASAAALAVLETIETEDVLGNVRTRSTQLQEGIMGLRSPLVKGVRGRGLLLGVELTRDVAPQVVETALAAGLIVNTTGPNLVRLAPPLIISEDTVAEFLELFAQVLQTLEGEASKSSSGLFG